MAYRTKNITALAVEMNRCSMKVYVELKRRYGATFTYDGAWESFSSKPHIITPCVGNALLFPMFLRTTIAPRQRVLCRNEQRLWPARRSECSSSLLVPACRVAHLVLVGAAACTHRTKCAAAACTTRVRRDAGGLSDCRVLPLCSGHDSR